MCAHGQQPEHSRTSQLWSLAGHGRARPEETSGAGLRLGADPARPGSEREARAGRIIPLSLGLHGTGLLPPARALHRLCYNYLHFPSSGT